MIKTFPMIDKNTVNLTLNLDMDNFLWTIAYEVMTRSKDQAKC